MLPARSHPRWGRLRRLLLWAVGGVAIVAMLVLLHRPLLAAFANAFRVDDPVPSDAIVELLGGISHRPDRVAELYKQGIAPLVLLGTSVHDDPLDSDETARTVNRLVTLGVPRAAIRVMPGEVESTFDEANRVRDEVLHTGLRRLTVVTTAFHTRRAGWVFRKVLEGLPVTVHTAAAVHPNYDEAHWYRSDEGLVLYFGELIKTLYYWLIY